MKKETGITIVICCVILALAGGFYLRSGAGGKPMEEEEQWSQTEKESGVSGQQVQTIQDSKETMESQNCAVYICGAIRYPGVYYFPEDARVCDAVEAAGGFTKKADISAINQARVIADGEQITVPSKKSGKRQKKNTRKGDSGSGQSDKININTAAKEELMTIPGIGESKAELILDYRKEHGDFQRTEDIMNISGIKEGIYNQIRDCIRVS